MRAQVQASKAGKSQERDDVGDLIGEIVDSELYFFSKSEFDAIRALDADRTQVTALFADMARVNALYMIAKAGSGHIGSSFSSMDILAHLHLEEMRGDDVFFSSKGHDAPALYATLIALGVLPEEKLHVLRRLDGLPGHPDIGTPGLVFNTGSLGMGISKAKGLVEANRRLGKEARVFVLTGDGELQEGQIWESLISAANRKHAEITVIVDHNKFQSDYSVQRTSSLGDLEAKFSAFGWRTMRVDGHDIPALAATLRTLADDRDAPKVIIADTIKGRGVSFMEGASIDSDVEMFKYHSGAPKADEYQRAVAELEVRISARLNAIGAAGVTVQRQERAALAAQSATQRRLFPAYTEALMAAARTKPEIVALDADLILDMGLISFEDEFADRFIECGIAEQDMVSQAGGMALNGLLPIVHSFSCFLTTRANEQIYNNATERSQIIYVGGLSGVLPAGPGHSHQSVREISGIGGIPNLVMAEPATPEDVAALFGWCLGYKGPSFLRMASIPYVTAAETPKGWRPVEGQGYVVREGADGVIFAAGLVGVAECLAAADLLAQQGRQWRVVAHPWLNRVDPVWLAETIGARPHVVTYDNHFVVGGQGQMLKAAIAALPGRTKPSCMSLGLHETPPSGRNDEVLARLGLDAAAIAQKIIGLQGTA